MSGLTFSFEEYSREMESCSRNHADAVRSLITSCNFDTYFNYLTPAQFLDFFSFSAPASSVSGGGK
ncbi:MAG: hypothetical protein ABIA62_07685 [Candidatus Woesearchaeota archaeon]